MQKSKHETVESVNVGAKERNARWWVKIFIAFHVIAITSWSLPNAAPAYLNGTENPHSLGEIILTVNNIYIKPSPVAPYLLSTGLWQSWDMFSPNPANTDIYADAEVHYRNGKTKIYQYPRMYALPIVQKYVKERFRKFFEHANSDTNLYPAFAQRIALESSEGPSNPVVHVALRRHFYEIPKITSFGAYSASVFEAMRSGHLSLAVLLPEPPAHPATYNEYTYYQYSPGTEKR